MPRARQSPTAALSGAEHEILSVYRAQNQAMVDGDIDLLNSILDDGYVAIHLDGHRQPKSEWLAQIRSGQMAYHGIQEQTVTVTVDGDDAVLESRAIVDATIHGAHAAWPLQSRTTLHRNAGIWRATSSRATLT